MFAPCEVSAEFEVRAKDLLSPDLRINVENITFEDKAIINVTTNSTFTGNITLFLNSSSEKYAINVVEGFGSIEIDGLFAGSYRAFAIFHKTDVFKSSTKMAKFNVNPLNADLALSVQDIVYGEVAKVSVKVNYGGKVINEGQVFLTINNKVYTADVLGGNAMINVPGLKAGTYLGDISYDGFNHSIKSVGKFSFRVLKRSVDLKASYNDYVINYGGKCSIVLKDNKGNVLSNKKVTFVLAGKAIGSAFTDAKGFATIRLAAKVLKQIKAGNKNLVIRYAGDDNYNALSKVVKIRVNKEKTKLTARKKSFKRALKTKKYGVVLKNSKGKAVKKVKLSLKVKGKTYKAKTNKKGKAVFKIKKLNKKGKYWAKIRFKGNRYYRSVSKKAKITVK